jgi:hypothetical protein
MAKDQRISVNQMSSLPLPKYRFVTNDYHLTPDSGHALKRSPLNVTVGEMTLLAMSTLKLQLQLQLMASVTIGNCCSGYHITMKSYLKVRDLELQAAALLNVFRKIRIQSSISAVSGSNTVRKREMQQ